MSYASRYKVFPFYQQDCTTRNTASIANGSKSLVLDKGFQLSMYCLFCIIYGRPTGRWPALG